MKKIFSILFTVSFFMTSGLSFGGQMSLGTKVLTWTTNYLNPVGGTEFYAPFSLDVNLNEDISLYGWTEFGVGHYSPAVDGSSSFDLSRFSDSIVGSEIRFKNFSIPALLNVNVNIPTGDPSWETNQISGNIPVVFMDSRYRGRGLGVNAMYGLSFPSGNTEFGAALGYSYSGSFNPGAIGGTPSLDLKMGDTYFLSLTHVTTFAGNQRQYFRLSGFAFAPTQIGGVAGFQQGINVNGSYSWVDPKGFSIDLGAQYFFASLRADQTTGALTTEPNSYYTPRLYATPSLAIGDLSVTAVAKYVFPNNYSYGSGFSEGGGLMAGLAPSLRLPMDESSDLRFDVGYDFILHHNAGLASDNVTLVEAYYHLFTFGAAFEVRL